MAVTNNTKPIVFSRELKIEETYQRVLKLKKEMGISFGKMAEKAGFSAGAMSKLTGQTRRMTEENLNKLVTYLESMGF